MSRLVTQTLRTARMGIARACAAAVGRWPSLEPGFIRYGRWLNRRSRALGTLYWFTQEELVPRLKQSGQRFRPLPVGGFDIWLDVTDSIGRVHYFYGEPYEPELSTAIVSRLSPGDVFLDIGANVGFFSLLAARCVGPTGRVIAFEPHPDAVATLRHAIALNRLDGIIDVVQTAIGSHSGTCRLYLSDDTVLSTADPSRSPVKDDYSFARAIDVPLISLDEWLASHAALVPRIRAIKIDVEGTEADVLQGFGSTLPHCTNASILCETIAGSPADATLRAHGYTVSALDERRGTFGNYCYERNATGSAPAGRSSPG